VAKKINHTFHLFYSFSRHELARYLIRVQAGSIF